MVATFFEVWIKSLFYLGLRGLVNSQN